MQRRLLYLWHILRRDKKELISRIFYSQKLSPSPGHWVKMVEMDKNKVGLILDDQEIEKMSKSMFQKVVKNKVETYALTQLEELKKKHSKSGRIESKKFETSKYLSDYRLNRNEQKVLFKLRTQTLDVKLSFQNQHENLLCSTCHLFPETQGHLLQCPEFLKNLQWIDAISSRLEINDIYSNLDKQIKIAKIFTLIIEERTNILSKNESGSTKQKAHSAWTNAPDAAVAIASKL